MWIVLKGKNKEIDFLQKNLIKKMGKDIMFYIPRYKTEIFKKNKVVTSTQLLMKNYIFCYHKNFKKRNNLNTVNFTKGLEYILKGHETNQIQIERFIKYCKSFECEKGFIQPIFFKSLLKDFGKFSSGPFKVLSFNIIEKQKSKLKILIGDLVTTVSDNQRNIYRPI